MRILLLGLLCLLAGSGEPVSAAAPPPATPPELRSVMAAFGVGFSLPLGAILLGVSLGKAAIKLQKAEAAIRVVAGVLLVCAGFYLLATF